MSRKITPTYILLNQITVSTLTESVIFNNIPQTYTDLVLSINSSFETFNTGNGKGATCVRFNSDSGSNYSTVQMSGDQNGPLSNTSTGTSMDLLINSYEDDINLTIYTAHIFDYAQTDKHKTVLSRASLAAGNQFPRVALNAYRWANTSQITSITLFSSVSGGRYNPGSTFYLYGVM
jgi:hypothetical protein